MLPIDEDEDKQLWRIQALLLTPLGSAHQRSYGLKPFASPHSIQRLKTTKHFDHLGRPSPEILDLIWTHTDEGNTNVADGTVSLLEPIARIAPVRPEQDQARYNSLTA